MKRSYVAIIGAAVVVLLAVSTVLVTRPAGPPAPEFIKIGVASAVTGRFSAEGKFGFDGMKLWEDEVNARGGILVKEFGKKLPVKLIHYDDESDRDKVAKLVERLVVEDQVHLLLGPYASPQGIAAAPIAEKHKMPMFHWGVATDALWDQGVSWNVGLITPASQYLWGTLEMIKKFQPGAKIAILHADDAFSVEAAKGAAKRAQETGLQIVFSQKYPADIKDFTPILLRLKELKPDALIGGGHVVSGLLLSRQLLEQKLDFIKLISLLVVVPIAQFGKELGPQAEGFMGPSQWEPGVSYRPEFGPTNADFVKRFQGKYNYVPEYRAAQGYFVGWHLEKIIEEAGSLAPEKILDAAKKLKFTTSYGVYEVTSGLKQLGHTMVTVQWQGGKAVIVWPPGAAEAQPQFPFKW